MDDAADTIAFAEKLLLLLDQGSFATTYKFAVLLAMIDVCMERTAADGSTPRTITPRELAAKTLDLYWPQAAPFGGRDGALVLRQYSGGQAAIVTAIQRFRERFAGDALSPARARLLAPDAFETLLDEVEWKLVEMPLPRLQIFGGDEERFLFDLDWDVGVRRRAVADGSVDTTIRLESGVGERLVRLSGLLRPLIQRQWAERVARFNRRHVSEFELEAFLFGVPRLTPARLVSGLREIQDDRCLYCDRRLEAVEVDHFIPWSRHPDDGIHNLVVAHRGCNNAKRDFLAATDHVERWNGRSEQCGSDLDALAAVERWASEPRRTRSVARAIYLRLPGDARLWLAPGSFVAPDLGRLRRLLTGEDRARFDEAAEPREQYDGHPTDEP